MCPHCGPSIISWPLLEACVGSGCTCEHSMVRGRKKLPSTYVRTYACLYVNPYLLVRTLVSLDHMQLLSHSSLLAFPPSSLPLFSPPSSLPSTPLPPHSQELPHLLLHASWCQLLPPSPAVPEECGRLLLPLAGSGPSGRCV